MPMATNVSLMHSDIQHTGDKFFSKQMGFDLRER